jgi:hypothetical protein
MEKIKNHELLNSSAMNSEGINFILLGSSRDEVLSPRLKKGLTAGGLDIPGNNLTGTLLLPFIGMGKE